VSNVRQRGATDTYRISHPRWRRLEHGLEHERCGMLPLGCGSALGARACTILSTYAVYESLYGGLSWNNLPLLIGSLITILIGRVAWISLDDSYRQKDSQPL
jgi:hypothetical protein